MSNESFKKFMAKVQNDQGLKQELRAAGGAAGMPVEAVVAFAAGKGYEFKVEDVSSELSDQQLNSVAGGINWGDGSLGSATAGLPSPYHKVDGLNTYLTSAGNLMLKF